MQTSAARSFREWLADVKRIGYGKLRLKPAELYALSPLEFDEIHSAYEEELLDRRWERAYWVSNIISAIAFGPLKKPKPCAPKELMKPFMPKKSGSEIAAERQRFFEEFEKKRREALENGRN